MQKNILYEDEDIMVVFKPAGIATQTARIGQQDMVSELKNYLAGKGLHKGEKEPYLGLVHRLDQPVQGVMVFAKTKQAAANLSEQIAQRKDSGQVVKRYCAVVHKNPALYKEGKRTAEYLELTDYLQRDRKTNTSYIVPKGTKGAKESRLRFAVLEEIDDLSLVDIELLTGRHHQIRVQFSHHGYPLYGDIKYNSDFRNRRDVSPALFAYHLSFKNPVGADRITVEAEPESEIFRL